MLPLLILASLFLTTNALWSHLTAHNLSAARSSEYFAPNNPRKHFGLLPNVSWLGINADLRELNSDPSDKLYRLFIFGRHGEGVHNLAEAKYGSESWDNHWSMKDGDGVLCWGPDANLTSLGEHQASLVHDRWAKEHTRGLSIPSMLYSSPLSRAIQTAELSFNLSSKDIPNIFVMEDLRETIGVHTCDERSTRSTIRHRFPFVQCEDHFHEKDDLWDANYRESDHETQVRAYRAITKIMSYECSLATSTIHEKKTPRVISVTSHSGFIRNMLLALNHDAVRLPTAGIMPLIIETTCHENVDTDVHDQAPTITEKAHRNHDHDQLVISRHNARNYRSRFA